MKPRFLLTLLLTAFAFCNVACGHCDGAIRTMNVGLGLDAAERKAIDAEPRFRITADGPADESDELLDKSGVGSTTWYLFHEATGVRIAATITGDSGGHMCRNGVGFNLVPDDPLQAGDYTLVLELDQLAWPLVGKEKSERFEGREALVRHYRVAN
jgi:hypothetical protein